MFDIESLDIPPLQGANGTVHLPGSKSISNRVLLLAALSQGQTVVHDLLASDDTAVMLAALKQMGCSVEQTGSTVVIDGLAGELLNRQGKLFMGNAGTAMRPLTAALALLGGDYELSGVPRMHERPIGDLVDALRQLGCRIDYLGNDGFPPLHLQPGKLALSKPIAIRGDVSSQFLTALLMALPLVAKQDIRIEVTGELISKPYIEITLNLLARFGILVRREGWQSFTIPAGCRYQSPGEIHVEGDASSASYFVALGAIATGADASDCIDIRGIGSASIQGDIRFVEAAQLMGAKVESSPNAIKVSRGAWPLKAIDLDCNHIPDAAMTLAVMALYADGTTSLRNIASWRVKETDRIAAMACELRKLGAVVEEGADFIRVTPPAQWHRAAIHTYDDHRVAMCFSLAAFNPAGQPVRILDPKCVAKTFPDYFETLFSLTRARTSDIPVICIDGPTASGKGTLASRTASQLGYHYLDSGALYRLTAYAAGRAGVALDDAAGVAAVAAALLALQRGFRQLPGLVTDGRDMGTVIFPAATLKVFLTASARCRAERRHKQLISNGISATLVDIEKDLEARDLRDSSRQSAPLKPAQDAKLLDNSEHSIEQSIGIVVDWWRGNRPL